MRFEQEARTLGNLFHCNIVKVLDYGEIDGRLFLLMEYVEGITLDKYIKQKVGPINDENTVTIMTQVLSAIQSAHDKNIVHRDLKPSNIIINPTNLKVSVIDFGIAKEVNNSNMNFTIAGQKLGTLQYMSPEQVRGLPNISFKTDIYSMGVLLFQMVCGKAPYNSELDELEIANKIATEKLPRINKIYPGANMVFQEIIDIATAKDFESRFDSCRMFSSSISQFDKLDKNETVKNTVFCMQKKAFVTITIGLIVILLMLINRNEFHNNELEVKCDNNLFGDSTKEMTSHHFETEDSLSIKEINEVTYVKGKKKTVRKDSENGNINRIPENYLVYFMDRLNVITDRNSVYYSVAKSKEEIIETFVQTRTTINVNGTWVGISKFLDEVEGSDKQYDALKYTVWKHKVNCVWLRY
jgi:serine/threonine protein kinase